ncbi:MAG: hypothetical protein HY278_01040 [candidate division NC10 bacterium]|nr:hypothetical protein [candidate division NC10 bacterium]
MKWGIPRIALAALLWLAFAGIGWGAEYSAPLPYTQMYDQLKVGMGWHQAHEITRAAELEREPADFEATDLLRLDQVNRRCQVQLLRLHWYKGELHWVERFQLDPAGVTYQERGDPDPIGERLVRRLTEVSNLYTSKWEEMMASIAVEGSPALQVKAKQAADDLKRRLEELRRETQR